MTTAAASAADSLPKVNFSTTLLAAGKGDPSAAVDTGDATTDALAKTLTERAILEVKDWLLRLPGSRDGEPPPPVSSAILQDPEGAARLSELLKEVVQAPLTVAFSSPQHEKVARDLAEAIEQGVSKRSAAGQRFDAWLAKASSMDKATYAGGDRMAKAAFRKKWAEQALRAHTESYSRRTQLEVTEGHEGEYLTPTQIVVAEGGFQRPEAIHSAMNYTNSALVLGGRYVHWCPMRRVVQILYLRRCSREAFTQAWERLARATRKATDNDSPACLPGGAQPGPAGLPDAAEHDDAEGPDDDGEPLDPPPKKLKRGQGANTDPSAEPPKPAPKPKAKAAPKAEGKPKAKAKAQATKASLLAAQKVKTQWATNAAQARGVLGQLDAKLEWQWARQCPLAESLRKDLAHLDELQAQDDFVGSFLVSEAAALRASHGDKLDDLLKSKIIPLTERVERLGKNAPKLLRTVQDQ